MKRIATLFLFLGFFIGFGQVPAYYSGIDFSQSGSDLKDDLATLISTTHSTISYSECWDVLKLSDLDPGSSTNVLLVYGHTDDANPITDRIRNKDLNGGLTGEWNREHVFPKSLGIPDLGTSGPGSDCHNLRASDVQQNGNRGNRQFASGSGNAGNAGSDWYPGDEWRGDCARIVMYMYLRYGSQCIPANAVNGTVNSSDANMIDLLLDWNAADPVSTHEQNRNDGIYATQNNRNPFIDNPYIATKIWGGTPAEDPWGGLGIENTDEGAWLTIYPNPSTNGVIYFSSSSLNNIEHLEIFNELGQSVGSYEIEKPEALALDLNQFAKGSYTLLIHTSSGTLSRKYILR